MSLEVLVSTLNTNPKELINKMNIQTDAIIICQCDRVGCEEVINNNRLVKIYYFNERGIGLSRNNALMRATKDIVLFADDDEVFTDNYEKIILDEFEKNKADFIVFDIEAYGNKLRKYKKIKNNKRIRFTNALRYGAVRFAVNLSQLKKKNVYFSLLFGGGSIYGSGEDSIFISDCLKNKMKVFQNKNVISMVNMESSSWFTGFNEKYYYDKGALFSAFNKAFGLFYLSFSLIKNNKNDSTNSLFYKIKNSFKGYIDFKNRRYFK